MIARAQVLNCTYEEYLNDDSGSAVPTLNSSVAKSIIRLSPAHAILEHPRYRQKKEDPSKCRDKGSAIHSLLLGKGHPIHIMQSIYGKNSKRAGQTVEDFTSSAAQEERDEAYAKGQIPLFEREAEELQIAAFEISRKLTNEGIHFDKCQTEFMIAWISEEGVFCRTSLDAWQAETLTNTELKTIFCSNYETCCAQSWRLGYHIELAARLDALTALFPDAAGRFKQRIAFCEIEPPYEVTVLPPDGTFMTYGIQQWERAKNEWKKALDSGYWPGYAKREGAMLTVPVWAVHKEMEEEYS